MQKYVNYLSNPLDVFRWGCERYLKWWNSQRLVARKYIFENRSQNSENLMLIVAGFQPFYWDVVFERVAKNCKLFKETVDVCVCVPKGEGKEIINDIKARCEYFGWSMLYLFEDRLAQAQNTAISLHPSARWIYKIDEDIIISDNYFSKLKNGYYLAEQKLFSQIGFVTPLLNLNAACVYIFLESVDKIKTMNDLFGEVKIRWPNEDLVHSSEEFAKWIWTLSVPFDDVAKEIEKRNLNKIYQANIRLSIGAILFTRDYWNSIGGFEVARIGAMGVEETQMNAYSFTRMQAIAIVGDTFAGHLGFYSQKEACKDFFINNRMLIK